MRNDTVFTLNTVTGRTGWVRRKIFEHAILSGGNLIEVQPGTKPFVNGMYKPRTTEEFAEAYPEKVVAFEPVDQVDETYNYEEEAE